MTSFPSSLMRVARHPAPAAMPIGPSLASKAWGRIAPRINRGLWEGPSMRSSIWVGGRPAGGLR